MSGTAAASMPGRDRYTVVHETRYAYRIAVSQSWQLAHLTPRELPWQHVASHEIAIDPATDERRDERDSFGNGVTHFALHGPHPLLKVVMRAQVEVGDRPPALPAGAAAPSWEAVRDAVRGHPASGGLLAARLCEASVLVPWSEAARAYAAPSLRAGRDWLEATTELMHRIHADFAFEPGATTVTTQVDEVLEQRRGVCQDFAHVMLACLRGHGLPARYTSGYLRTNPPAGQQRLLGADTSHAWIAAWAPGHGWVEFDPTNDTLADRRHLTLAWGCDFADVVPLRGVILGGRGQSMAVEVSVIPE